MLIWIIRESQFAKCFIPQSSYFSQPVHQQQLQYNQNSHYQHYSDCPYQQYNINQPGQQQHARLIQYPLPYQTRDGLTVYHTVGLAKFSVIW